jgi:AcrR family transcriptional regulator
MKVQAERPYHHGNLRAALLEQAERTLSERGAGELSLRELAREVGVSHGAPRRHFADKRALLDALAEDGFERLGRALGEADAHTGDGFEERFTAFARAYIGFATRHAALLELMYAGKHRPGAAESLREAGTRAFAIPLALIAEAQATGEVVPGDPLEVAIAAFAAIHGLAALANAGMLDPAALDDLVGASVARLVAGLRPR